MRRSLVLIRRLLVAAFVPCFLGWAAAQAAERSSSYLAAVASIRSGQLQAHVDVLADDDLEGREAGSRGGRAAGDYVASRMHELGLAPAGDDGYFQPFGSGYRNVLARLDGSDPALRDQVIVVGAHYDHVGYGTRRNSLGPVGQIHNGADDNASGTSGLVELAEAFTMLAKPPRRSILFVGWDAEEKGLLGSQHWVAQPTVPLRQVVAMLNMDMIGRLRNDHLILFGSRTGVGLRRLVSTDNEGLDLELDFSWTMRPDADHYPFFDHGIPVLMANTGLHGQYHRPTDDAGLINAEGMQRVVRLLFAVAYDLANDDELPAYREAARRESDRSRQVLTGRTSDRHDRLGAGWDEHDRSGEGVRLSRIVWGSPADKAMLRLGDRIVQFAGRKVHSADELAAAVMSAPSPTTVVVQRPGEDRPIELTVSLNGAPMRIGIRWRVDDAEPGVIILTGVVPGSPAAHAGLAVGDRIYQIAGRDFTGEEQFAELARTLPDPIVLVVERKGQIHTVALHFAAESFRRAA